MSEGQGAESAARAAPLGRLAGHRTTTVTETVYRQQLRPVIEDAATAMNRIFPARDA